jgi:hypothetical protein
MKIAHDAGNLFNSLTGYSEFTEYDLYGCAAEPAEKNYQADQTRNGHATGRPARISPK